MGSSRCGWPLSPDWPDHKCERAQRELTCVLLSLRCPGLPSALPRARLRLWQLPDGGVRWAAVPNRDRKVPGPARGGDSASGPLCEPTAPRGGWRCASHHPPTHPSVHPSLCRTLPRSPEKNKPTRPALPEGSQGGHCGRAVPVPRAVPEGQEAKGGEGQPHCQVTTPGSVSPSGGGRPLG